MPYTAITLGDVVNEVAARLYDPAFSHWYQAELQQRTYDVLMTWNALTNANVQWYTLPVTAAASPWSDLLSIPGSPREALYSDTDVYSRIQYHLLESQQADAATLTTQFTADQIVSAVQAARDEFLMAAKITRSVTNLNVTPNVATANLPETVIQVERGYWIPAVTGSGAPLYRVDQQANAAFASTEYLTPGSCEAMSIGVEPPLTVRLIPPPDQTGLAEMITVNSQGILSASTPTKLNMLSDFMPAIMWGALYYLLSTGLEAQDQMRASYARKRFEQGIELASNYAFLMGARLASGDAMVGSVEEMDAWNPGWRTSDTSEPIVTFSGQNLICYPTNADMQIGLFMNGNANLPVSLTDPIQVGREYVDAIIGMVQHEASFKMGGSNFSDTAPLMQAFMDVAKQRNSQLAAMSTYKVQMFSGLDIGQKTLAPLDAEQA